MIPNDLYDLLENHDRSTLDEIKIAYEGKFDDVIEEYFEFLVAKDLGHWVQQEQLALFPKLDLDWDSPSMITNAIIDHDSDSNHDHEAIIEQLNVLGCQHLLLRFYNEVKPNELDQIFSILDGSRILSVEVVVRYSSDLYNEITGLRERHGRLRKTLMHGAPKDEIIDPRWHLISTEMTDQNHCGAISSYYFSINVKTFSEAQAHNTCLNQKISINTRGEIMNCPTMEKSYGNINDVRLESVLEDADYLSYWGINKDQIDVCRDCEFRYICTDCRAFLGDSRYGKPEKCDYDPYADEYNESNFI